MPYLFPSPQHLIVVKKEMIKNFKDLGVRYEARTCIFCHKARNGKWKWGFTNLNYPFV